MTAELLDEKRSFLNRVVFTTVVDRFEDEYCKAFTIFSGCCKKELLEGICGYFDVDESMKLTMAISVNCLSFVPSGKCRRS